MASVENEAMEESVEVETESEEVPLEVVEGSSDTRTWEDALIEEVRNCPVLWDKSRRDYGHSEISAACWKSISRTLNRNPNECMDKWKNLRDSYVRRLKCVRRVAYHGLTPKKPNWRYFESFSFLDDHINHRINQVDTLNEDPLPNYSSRDLVFFNGKSQGAPRTPLGGMGKPGPAAVHLSALKEPVPLFSRVGLGEISVINDANEAKVIGSLLDQLSQNSSMDGLDEESTEKESEVIHVLIEDGEIVREEKICSTDTSEIELSAGTVNEENSVDSEYTEALPMHATDENLSSAQGESVSSGTVSIIGGNLFSGSENYKRRDVIGSRRLRTNRKRSYSHRWSDSETVEVVKVPNCDDDTTKHSGTVNELNSSERDFAKRTVLVPDVESPKLGPACPDLNSVVELIHIKFDRIESKLESLNDMFSDNHIFARYITQTLSQLPDALRNETKIKIQKILFEAQCRDIERSSAVDKETMTLTDLNT